MTVVTRGFLQVAPFLQTYPFLSTSQSDVSEGAQFKAIISKEVKQGSQLVAPQLRSGMQFRGLNSGTANHGMQIVNSYMLHVPCGSGLFLNSPFLRSRFLTPSMCAFAGMQISAKNENFRNTGAQFKGVIYDSKSYGAQFKGLIYQDSPYGAQLKSINTKEATYGSQFQGIIQAVRPYGVQFLGRIYKENLYGAQLTSVRNVETGMQIRSVLYNVTQIRVLCDFASRGTSPNNWNVASGGTAASSTNGFNVNNLNTDIVEQVYRSTATSIQITCDTGIPQGAFVDTLGILNHNMTRSANVLFEGSNVSDFSVTTAIAQFNPIQKNAYWLSPEAPLTSYRYWRITIQDATNQNGYIEIGTIVFGSADVFTTQENFVDRVIFSQKQFKDQVFTEGHTNVSNDRGKKRSLTLEFKNLIYQKQNWNILSGLFETYGTTHKCLWIPEPRDPGRFAVFGKLSELPQEEHNYKGLDADYVAVNLTVDEAL
jgi:hypothetical protein